METVIALDIGTTHLKAALFDKSGRVLRLEKCPTPIESEENGQVYSAARFRETVLGQLENLLSECDSLPSGICITGMAEAGLVMSRVTEQPLTEILPWFDPRTRELADALSPEESDRLVRSTGLRNSFKYGIYKYRWLLENRGLERKDTVWLSVCDYIAWCLTGEMATDPTFAARTYCYDVFAGTWDLPRLEAYGLTEANFPRIVPSGTPVGTWRGIQVAIGGHDHLCAAFGLLNEKRDGLCDSAGTSETYVGLLSGEQLPDGFPENTGLLYGPFVDGGYFFMGNVPSSGHSVEWFRKKLQYTPLEYDRLDRSLEELPGDPGEILYLPYLTGMGAPWYRSDLKAALLGVDEHHTGPQVLKGIVEGIQYQAKWLINIVRDAHGAAAPQVICAGGSSRSRAMMQIKANVLGRTVCVPAVTEATLCGAAALFLAKNHSRQAAKAFLANAARIEREYHAEPETACAYEQMFSRRYLPAVQLLAELSR